MKKMLVSVLLLALAVPAFAADTKVTALSADTAPTATDLIMVVDDVSGTPTSKKVALGDLDSLFVETSLATNNLDAANAITFASNAMLLEGATADDYETTISPADPTADQTITIPNNGAASALMTSALTTNAVDAANSVTGKSNGLLFEGATADDYETSLVPTDVSADATITLPTKTGTLHGSGAVVALTPGATPTLTVVPGRQVFTYQPADNTDATFNASGAGSAGDSMTFIFTTDAAGSGDEVMTFGTNMYSTGTLTMANLAADIYVVSFVSNGSAWVEVSRTAVQTT